MSNKQFEINKEKELIFVWPDFTGHVIVIDKKTWNKLREFAVELKWEKELPTTQITD